MTTMIALHETENGERWAKAWHKGEGSRHEMFDKIGVKCRTFRDPNNHNSTGAILEIPDMVAFENFMASDEAKKAMAEDGVKVESLRMLVEFTS